MLSFCVMKFESYDNEIKLSKFVTQIVCHLSFVNFGYSESRLLTEFLHLFASKC